MSQFTELDDKISIVSNQISQINIEIKELETKLLSVHDPDQNNYFLNKALSLSNQLPGLQNQLAELFKEKYKSIPQNEKKELGNNFAKFLKI